MNSWTNTFENSGYRGGRENSRFNNTGVGRGYHHDGPWRGFGDPERSYDGARGGPWPSRDYRNYGGTREEEGWRMGRYNTSRKTYGSSRPSRGKDKGRGKVTPRGTSERTSGKDPLFVNLNGTLQMSRAPMNDAETKQVHTYCENLVGQLDSLRELSDREQLPTLKKLLESVTRDKGRVSMILDDKEVESENPEDKEGEGEDKEGEGETPEIQGDGSEQRNLSDSNTLKGTGEDYWKVYDELVSARDRASSRSDIVLLKRGVHDFTMSQMHTLRKQMLEVNGAAPSDSDLIKCIEDRFNMQPFVRLIEDFEKRFEKEDLESQVGMLGEDGSRDTDSVTSEGRLEKEEGRLAKAEMGSYSGIANRISELAFRNEEDIQAAIKMRKSELDNEHDAIIPSKLIGFRIEDFESVEEYDRYAWHIFRAATANRLMVLEKTKKARSDAQRGDWSMEREHVESSRIDQEYNYSQSRRPGRPDQVDDSAAVKRVGFADLLRSSRRQPDIPSNETYTTRDHGGSRKIDASTPKPGHDKRNYEHRIPDRIGGDPRNNESASSVFPSLHHQSPAERSKYTYDHYCIPPKYRSKDTGLDTQFLSSTVVGHSDQSLGEKQDASSGHLTLQTLMASLPITGALDMFEQFSGEYSKYQEWKTTTKTLLLGIEPPCLKAIKLKKLLKAPEQALVGHVRHDDPTAVDDIWKELDRQFGGTVQQADYHVSKLLNWLRNGAKCHDFASLLHLYNFLRENYYAIARLGAERVATAEAVSYGISALLFGKSQREVNRMRNNEDPNSVFNMSKVFGAIERHLADLQKEERDKEKYEASAESLLRDYSEQDLPFLRRGVLQEEQRDQYKGSNRNNIGYDGWYGGKSVSKYAGGYDGRKDYRDRERSRERSPYRYDGSKDYKDRGRSRERSPYKRPPYIHRNSKERQGGKSPDRDGQKGYDKGRGGGETGSSIHELSATVEDHSRLLKLLEEVKSSIHISSGKVEDPLQGRGGRGSSSRSPSRSKRDRPWNTFSCVFCLTDDHDTFICNKLSVEDRFRKCNERRLCYVCCLTGHNSSSCRATEGRCTDSRCRPETKHHKMFCFKFKKD